MRAAKSTGPPAGNGTTRVTGRVGQFSGEVCACAAAAMTANTAANTALTMFVLPGQTIAFFVPPARAPAPSIGDDACSLDHLAPALDVLRQILGQIFRRALVRRQDFEPELFQALADVGVVDGVAHRLVELAHDRIRCALRQEESVPDGRLDAWQALLAGGPEVGDDR